MKLFGSISRLAGLTVALAAGLIASSAQASINTAVLRTVRGTVMVSNDGGEMKPAKVGMRLKPNSVIKTGSGESFADVFLNQNGPIVRVRPDTQLGIDKLDYEDTGVETVIETQLDLKSGRVLGNVKKLASASKYEVKTPRGVAAVRGTDFDISSDGTVNVISGRIDVVYVLPDGTRTAVLTGTDGQTISPPIDGATVGKVSVTPGQVTIYLKSIFPPTGPGGPPGPPNPPGHNPPPQTESAPRGGSTGNTGGGGEGGVNN